MSNYTKTTDFAIKDGLASGPHWLMNTSAKRACAARSIYASAGSTIPHFPCFALARGRRRRRENKQPQSAHGTLQPSCEGVVSRAGWLRSWPAPGRIPSRVLG